MYFLDNPKPPLFLMKTKTKTTNLLMSMKDVRNSSWGIKGG